ncbi:hypothetical protein CH333_04555 [candidate division WOR-3 bacterium JGI_Cruoil_03_44_89]|uniref:DUF2905 domain-containing protein n=1 Tax=candidate division WOR-3 bacterium JGI_Cruoil_03_44_89 TaxID=1973748 RepID=A0A235BUA5_UNCW3|nr:MAG: hypothetical protein CH333_04555 [candidate division WOR-3 bacterium JGI_Cruoil_03_44_89]
MGKLLILGGIVLIGVGLFLFLFGKVPWIGKLPGDIYIKKEHFTFYFPLTTCILISVVLSAFFLIFRR